MQHRNNATTNDIKARMRERLREIDKVYDFSHFTFPSFQAWIEQTRGKPLRLVPDKMIPHFFGAWIETDEEDFVFYKEDTIPLHQTHIVLHEMAHMLCGHPTLRLDRKKIAAYVRGEVDIASLLLRSPRTDEMEWEAELLAALIQESIFSHARVQELIGAVLGLDRESQLYKDTGLLD